MSLLRAVHKKVGMFLTGVLLIGSFGAAGAPLEVSAAPNLKGPKDPQEVEQFIDAFFANPEIKENMAGASVVIVRGDDVLMKKGYGYADLEKKRPVNPDQTVFRIASVSKVFTSSAVMQLVEQGKIDLNEDLSAYLGEVRIPNHTDAPLTMKHLLTNSTGFEYGDTSELKTTDLEKEIPLQQFVIDNAPTVIRKPGEYYRYDNVGFTIQGYVVEHVSGQPFGAYIKDHIYEPLGMTNSSFSLTPSIMKHLAVPYNVLGEPIPTYATVPTELPAGGMLSTPADMAKFMMAFLNGGKLGAKRILSEESVSEMLKPQFGIHPRLPNMGYGFEYSYRQAYNGYYVIEKGGDVDGYHSNM